MSRERTIRNEFEAYAAEYGVEVTGVKMSGACHWRITLRDPKTGRTHSLTASQSCSDTRALERRRQDVRRFARGVY